MGSFLLFIFPFITVFAFALLAEIIAYIILRWGIVPIVFIIATMSGLYSVAVHT